MSELPEPYVTGWEQGWKAANDNAEVIVKDLVTKLQHLIDRPEVTPEGYYTFPDGETWVRTFAGQVKVHSNLSRVIAPDDEIGENGRE